MAFAAIALSQASNPSGLDSSQVREGYGSGYEDALPDSVAFFSLIDGVADLSGYRYEIALEQVQSKLRVDQNQAVAFIDRAVEFRSSMLEEMSAARVDAYCGLIGAPDEEAKLYEAMDDIDDSKAEVFESYHRKFVAGLSPSMLPAFEAWVGTTSRDATYVKTDHRAVWTEFRDPGAAQKWLREFCKENS